MEKRPIEETTSKGNRASDIIIALQEYTALAKDQFNKKNGKSMGSSEHVAQSAYGGDP